PWRTGEGIHPRRHQRRFITHEGELAAGTGVELLKMAIQPGDRSGTSTKRAEQPACVEADHEAVLSAAALDISVGNAAVRRTLRREVPGRVAWHQVLATKQVSPVLRPAKEYLVGRAVPNCIGQLRNGEVAGGIFQRPRTGTPGRCGDVAEAKIILDPLANRTARGGSAGLACTADHGRKCSLDIEVSGAESKRRGCHF